MSSEKFIKASNNMLEKAMRLLTEKKINLEQSSDLMKRLAINRLDFDSVETELSIIEITVNGLYENAITGLPVDKDELNYVTVRSKELKERFEQILTESMNLEREVETLSLKEGA